MESNVAPGPADIISGSRLMSSGSGKWAGERFMRAAANGEDISPSHLRTNELLRNEEWKVFDNAVISGATERIRAVRDLIGAGLFTTIPNGLAKTVLEYDLVGDMDEAIVSLDGVTRSENDRLEYSRKGLPLPITHKDWYLNLRALRASRLGTEPLDTTYSRVAGRKCGEKTEHMLFAGGKTFGSLTIYGLLTHPNRNTAAFGTNGNWSQVAKTGTDILNDVFTMITLLEADGFDGPYWLYYGGTQPGLKLSEDFKAATSGTIRQRLLDTQRISKIEHSSKIPANQVVMFQPTEDVVKMIIGEDLQTIQWDVHGGMQINFKAFQIAVPLVRATPTLGSGIAHMS